MVAVAEAALKEVWDGGHIVHYPDIGDPARNAGENEHSQHIGDGGNHRLGAAGVGHAGPAHEAAAADNGGADGGHHDPGAQGPPGHIVVPGILDALHKVNAHQYHGQQVGTDNKEINDTQLSMIHKQSFLFR